MSHESEDNPLKEKNGWQEWSKHVLKELERFDELLSELNRTQVDIKIEIAMLKVKSSLWGMIAGSIPVGIMAIVQYLTK